MSAWTPHWLAGAGRGDNDLPWNEWVYQAVPIPLNLNDATAPERLAELDAAWGISSTGNNEVLFAWLEQSIEAKTSHRPGWKRSS